MSNFDKEQELSELIESLTTSGSQKLDDNLFRRVKSICKKSDENVRHLYRMVRIQLEKRHSEIRLSTLQIIDEIFSRSHTFRELLLDDFDEFFCLTTGVNSKTPLPEPRAVALKLRTDALKAIERWHEKYGQFYIKLELGYTYLKTVKKVNFTSSQPQTELERLRAEDLETRRSNLARQKLNLILNQMNETTAELQNFIKEMNSCFCLILPKPEEFEIQQLDEKNAKHPLTFDNNIPSTSAGIAHISQKHNEQSPMFSTGDDAMLPPCQKNDHGLSMESFKLTIPINNIIEIKESTDNIDILNTLRELHKQLVDKYLPLTQKWLEILTKHSEQHVNLIQAIDLKSSLTDLKYKYDKLRIVSKIDQEKEDQETDHFIDVAEKEGIEYIPKNRRHEYGLKPVKQILQHDKAKDLEIKKKSAVSWNPNGDLSSLGDPTARVTAIKSLLQKHEKKINMKPTKQKSSYTSTNSKSREEDIPNTSSSQTCDDNKIKREKLLKKAPVVPFGMDLYNWERKDDEAPPFSDLKSLHCFWAHPNEENEDHFPSDMKESMKSRSISFPGHFEEVKWTCRAPLPSGKLCPRRDRLKCPFHGQIVARESNGQPKYATDELPGSRAREITEVTRDIEMATGIDLGSHMEKKRKKRKYSGLTDIKKSSNTSRSRLEKIVFNKESMKRVTAENDRIKKRLLDEKFGNNWNYALN